MYDGLAEEVHQELAVDLEAAVATRRRGKLEGAGKLHAAIRTVEERRGVARSTIFEALRRARWQREW